MKKSIFIQAAGLICLAALLTGCNKDGLKTSKSGAKITYNVSDSDSYTKSGQEEPQATGVRIPVEIDGEKLYLVEYVQPISTAADETDSETKGRIMRTGGQFSFHTQAFADGPVQGDLPVPEGYNPDGKTPAPTTVAEVFQNFNNGLYYHTLINYDRGTASSTKTYNWLAGVGLHFWSHTKDAGMSDPTFSSDKNSMEFDYTEGDTATNQGDILIGYSHVGSSNQGTVDIKLYHPLSVVDFDIKWLIQRGYIISSASISGVPASGHCKATHNGSTEKPTFVWSNLGQATTVQQSYNVNSDFQPIDVERGGNTEEAYILPAGSSSKHFMVIPQTSLNGKSITVNFEKNGTKEQKTINFPENGKWEEGMRYSYVLQREAHYIIDEPSQTGTEINADGSIEITFNCYKFDGDKFNGDPNSCDIGANWRIDFWKTRENAYRELPFDIDNVHETYGGIDMEYNFTLYNKDNSGSNYTGKCDPANSTTLRFWANSEYTDDYKIKVIFDDNPDLFVEFVCKQKTGKYNEQLPPVQIVAKSTDNSITYSWNPVKTAIKNKYATAYMVSTDGGNSYTSNGTNTTYTISGLSKGTEKTIYVKAIGDGGSYSSDSEPASCTASAIAPKLGTPQNLRVTNTATDALTIAWNAVDNATSYYVTWSPASSGGSNSRTVTGTSCSITGLSPNTEYVVTVVAKADNYSDSEAVTGKFKTAEETKEIIVFEDTISPFTGQSEYFKVEGWTPKNGDVIEITMSKVEAWTQSIELHYNYNGNGWAMLATAPAPAGTNVTVKVELSDVDKSPGYDYSLGKNATVSELIIAKGFQVYANGANVTKVAIIPVS